MGITINDNIFRNLHLTSMLSYPEVYTKTKLNKNYIESFADKKSIVSLEFNIKNSIYSTDHVNIRSQQWLLNDVNSQKRLVNIIEYIKENEEFEEFIVKYNKLMYENQFFLSSYNVQIPSYNLYIGKTLSGKLEIFLISHYTNIYKVTISDQNLSDLLQYLGIMGIRFNSNSIINILSNIVINRTSSISSIIPLGFLFNPENKIEIYCFRGINLENQYYSSIFPYVNYMSEGSGIYIDERMVTDYNLIIGNTDVCLFKSSDINYERYKNPSSSYRELGSKEIFDLLNTEQKISEKFKSFISTVY